MCFVICYTQCHLPSFTLVQCVSCFVLFRSVFFVPSVSPCSLSRWIGASQPAWVAVYFSEHTGRQEGVGGGTLGEPQVSVPQLFSIHFLRPLVTCGLVEFVKLVIYPAYLLTYCSCLPGIAGRLVIIQEEKYPFLKCLRRKKTACLRALRDAKLLVCHITDRIVI